jgi:hypothetical protein
VQERFVRILDEYADCVDLDSLYQEAGQGVASYTEAYAAAVDHTRHPAKSDDGPLSDWKEQDDYYIFKMLKQADPTLRDAVVAHNDYNKRGTKTDYATLTALMKECEANLAGSGTFSAATASTQRRPNTPVPDGNRRDRSPSKQRRQQQRNQQRRDVNQQLQQGQRQQTPRVPPHQQDKPPCTRCGKQRHMAEECKSHFDAAGIAIAGKPPGQPDGWVNNYRGCNVNGCGSMEHKSFACPNAKHPRARGNARSGGAPAVRGVLLGKRKRGNEVEDTLLSPQVLEQVVKYAIRGIRQGSTGGALLLPEFDDAAKTHDQIAQDTDGTGHCPSCGFDHGDEGCDVYEDDYAHDADGY